MPLHSVPLQSLGRHLYLPILSAQPVGTGPFAPVPRWYVCKQQPQGGGTDDEMSCTMLDEPGFGDE